MRSSIFVEATKRFTVGASSITTMRPLLIDTRFSRFSDAGIHVTYLPERGRHPVHAGLAGINSVALVYSSSTMNRRAFHRGQMTASRPRS